MLSVVRFVFRPVQNPDVGVDGQILLKSERRYLNLRAPLDKGESN